MPRGIAARAAGVIQTTMRKRPKPTLFGEQVVLCGGVSEPRPKRASRPWSKPAISPEMAYFECMHELKLIVDLFYQGGLNYMRYSVSNTAEFRRLYQRPRSSRRDRKR